MEMDQQAFTENDIKLEFGNLVIQIMRLRRERDYYAALLEKMQQPQAVNGEEQSGSRTPKTDMGEVMPKEVG